MAILIGMLAAAGVLCIAAFGYRIGYRAGLAGGRRLSDDWRSAAVSMMNTKADNVESWRAFGEQQEQIAAQWKRRANLFGAFLHRLGYTILEIEEPATGKITYQAVANRPAAGHPSLGPSLN